MSPLIRDIHQKRFSKRLQKYNWIFYTPIKRNRKFNGAQVQLRHRNPYWLEAGTIDGNFKVLVVKNGKKYFVTNQLTATKPELLAAYRTRWKIETMFRTLYNQLGLEECQARSLTTQTAHINLCFMAFVVLERARLETNQTSYQLRREYRFHPNLVDNLFTQLNLVGA